MAKILFLILNTLLFSGSILYIKNTVKPFDLLDTVNKNHPISKEFQDYQRKYGNKDTLTIAINFKRNFLKDPKAILKIDNITQDLEGLSPTFQVSSLTNSTYYTLSNGLFKTKYFFDEKNKRLSFEKNLFKSPLYKNIFWDKTKTISLLYLRSNRGPGDLKKAISYLRSKKEIHLFGHGYFQQIVREEGIKGQILAVPIFVLITFFFFYFVFKSFKVSLASLYIIGLSYSATLVFIIFREGTMSPFGSLALLISFIMALSDLVHYFYFEQKPFKVIRPCFYTSITTMIGLFSLCISDIEPVFNFGLYSGFAVMVSFLSTFFILPQVSKIFNVHPKKSDFLSSWGPQLYNFCSQKKKSILLIFALLTTFFATQMRDIKFKENFLEQFRKGHPFSKDADFFRKKVDFSGTIDVLLLKNRDDLLSAGFMPIEKEIKKQLMKHPSILNVQSVLNIKEDLLFRSQLSKENISVLDQFSIFEPLLPSEADESRLVITLKDQDSDQLKDVVHFINQTFKNNKLFPKIKISGYSKVRFQIMNFLFTTFYGSFFLSLIGIFICFLLLFKSLKLALMGLIPNLLPVIFISGIQGAFGIGVNFYLVVLNCIVLGISVDDTIHFLYHYDQEKTKLSEFLPTIAPPLCMTTFLLCILLPFFYLSAFLSFAQVSLFLCGGFLTALVADLVLLPSLLLAKKS
ncbi:MAG: hypothetical protein VYD54_05680 [Bdellovibrionota bacterium]|nr:hypothetical protein [Bdellovibrionota bacterium]